MRENFFSNNYFPIFIILANLLAGVFSFSYYFWQFELFSPIFWLFIADCPLCALLFAFSVLLFLFKKKAEWIFFVSIASCLKYGFWTIIVLIVSGGALSFWWVVLAHALLALETLLFFGVFEFKPKHVFVAVLWFLFNDFLDYGLSLHPFVLDGYLLYALIAALALSLVLPLVVFFVFSKKSKLLFVKAKSI